MKGALLLAAVIATFALAYPVGAATDWALWSALACGGLFCLGLFAGTLR